MLFLPSQMTCQATTSLNWQKVVALLLVTLLALPSGCFFITKKEVLKMYSGPERSDAEVASLELDSRLTFAQIDGQVFDSDKYGFIKLLPGTHQFEFVFGDVLFLGDRFSKVTFEAEVHAKHSYRLEVRKKLLPYGALYGGHGYWFSMKDMELNTNLWEGFGMSVYWR